MRNKNIPIEISNTTLIGKWEEVKGIQASTITGKVGDNEELNGLIVRGYEMKFDKVNENGEKYSKDAFSKYIENYFVKNSINLPVDLMHRTDFEHTVGRVIYAEVNSSGLYFVAYIPSTEVLYEQIKNKLQEGILQGFSKSGWATDYEYIYTKKGDFDYLQINEFMINAVSLVATPANRLKFEKVQEVKNALTFKNKIKKNNFFK